MKKTIVYIIIFIGIIIALNAQKAKNIHWGDEYEEVPINNKTTLLTAIDTVYEFR